jgi:hypothetical protein
MRLKDIPVTVNLERLADSTFPAYSGWINGVDGSGFKNKRIVD